jgi:ATP-dependent Zn protease
MFIDEIDTVPARGSGKGNDDWWTAITNTLLECLDGFERREGVVVIAACNDPARLDPALVRAGRLDRQIEIPLPDVPALAGILRTHLGNDLAGVDLRPAALAGYGRTGADVERFVREARGLARRAGRAITMDDLLASMHDGAPEWPAELRRRIA